MTSHAEHPAQPHSARPRTAPRLLIIRCAMHPVHPRTADNNARPSRVAGDRFVSEGSMVTRQGPTLDPRKTSPRYRCGRVRRFNPRRVKVHRSYTVDEVARMFEAHKNTVRAWLRDGLKPIDQRRPDPHPGWAACRLCRCAPQEEAAALPTGRILLFPLPHAQGCGRRHGRISAGHTQFGQSEGSLRGLRHPHVPAGRLAQAGGCGGRSTGRVAAGTATLNRMCRPFPKL